MRIDTGPYRFTRNPIYFGMFLGLVGLAIAFDSLWLLVALVPFALVIRLRADSLRCRISEAIGAKRTSGERRERVDLTKMMLWTAPTLRHQGAIGWLRRNDYIWHSADIGSREV